MPNCEWDSALETGDEVVDSQHRYLVSLFKQLLDAEAGQTDGPSVADVLDRLAMYAATHFGEEESLMVSTGFPDELAEAHRAEHRDLSEKARRFVLDYREGKVASIVPVVEFLSDWLGHHIEQEDRRLVDHVRCEPDAL